MLYARLIGTDQARDDDQYNSRPGQRAGVSAQEWNKCKADNGCRDMRPTLPMTHFARRQMCKILKTQRAKDQRQGARADYRRNLLITKHDGRNTFR